MADDGARVRADEHAIVRARRGTSISCKGWAQEAALRMLRNNLDAEVGEHPQELVVYGGSGKAARDWRSFHAIERALQELEGDETLLVQSGKPVGVLRTHEWAPRVLIASANLVPEWATWEEFTVTSGAGGMGGAQPLAVTMNGGTVLCFDVDPTRVERRLQTDYLDTLAHDLDEAIELADGARRDARALSIGLVANGAQAMEEIARREVVVGIATDQTPAHDPMSYVPAGLSPEDAAHLRRDDPREYLRRARTSMAAHCAALVELMGKGAEVFDYGNSVRAEAKEGGFERAFDYPGFVPAYIRPLFCEGKGPFRWAALSGDPADTFATDAAVADLFSDNDRLVRWIKTAGSVASPYRETEAMRDGSDVIADWPPLAAEKLARVLTNDPATGVMRHVDAGYDEATVVAERMGVRVPMGQA